MVHHSTTDSPRGQLPPAHRRPLVCATGLILVEAALELARPWPLQLVVDHVLADRPLGGWGAPLAGASDLAVAATAAAAVVALALCAGAVSATATVLVGRTAEDLGLRTRRRLAASLLVQPVSFFARHRTAELVTRVTNDVDRVDDAVVAWWEIAVPEVVVLCGTFVVLALIDLWMALVALTVAPVLLVVMVRRRRVVRAVHDAARDAEGSMAHRTADLVRNMRVVQAFGAERVAARTFEQANRRAATANVEAVEVEARSTPLVDVVLAVGAAAVLLLGTLRTAQGEMSPGTLVVSLSYVSGLHTPLRSLSALAAMLARAESSRRRLAEVLDDDRPPAVDRAVRAASVQGWATGQGAALEGVVFTRGDRRVLDGIDLHFPGGAVTALVGPTGAGKTTVLDLLLRLEEPDAGRVLVDGRDVADLDPCEVRRRIAYVPQESWFLDDTVRANIELARPGASRSAVEAAARAGQVHAFALRLPDGLDSRVGESGLLLSGGERKRLSVARAVLRDASLLLLDEPTAGLDDDSSDLVLGAVRAAARGRTIVVVTHDPRVVAWADGVRVLAASSRPCDRDHRPTGSVTAPVAGGR